MEKNIEELKKYGFEPIRIEKCETVTVIKIEYVKGLGNKESPIRLVHEYRTLEGKKIGEIIF